MSAPGRDSFVLIGRLDRPPMLRYRAGRPPTAVLIVESAYADGTRPERYVVRFTGEEASGLFRRLAAGQRLLIHASRQRGEIVAYTVRILDDDTPKAPRTPEERAARRSELTNIFLRLRARRFLQEKKADTAPVPRPPRELS